MQAFAQRLLTNPARDWVLLFLLIQSLINVEAFTNPASRWATLAAMAEDHTVRIDNYHQHTIDWARTPDGHYYSNKAPGPMLLGFPLFWAMDKLLTAGTSSREARDEIRIRKRLDVMHVLSIVTQAIPYAVMTMLLAAALQELSVPLAGVHFATVAMLFGNSAALFMNTYFGHAMGATFVLATFLALHRERPLRVGLFFGLSVLCDYGAALLIVPVLYLLLRRGPAAQRRRNLICLALGGLGPAIASAAYNTYCFGGPFATVFKYDNPEFVDLPSNVPTFYGLLRLIPDPASMIGLLFQPERGIGYTQGWVLIGVLVFVILFWRGTKPPEPQYGFLKFSACFAGLGLVLLLWMNACWTGWHGGMTPGPRYMSIIFPVVAVAVGAAFPHAASFWRQALSLSLLMSLVLFALVFSTMIVIAPMEPLIEFYAREMVTNDQGSRLKRLLLISLGMGWVAFRAWQRLPRANEIRRSDTPTGVTH